MRTVKRRYLSWYDFCFWLGLFFHDSNSISVISWWWCDVGGGGGERPNIHFYRLKGSPTPYRHGMRETGLWWRCKLYTEGKWISAQLNVMTVTGFIPLSPWLPTHHLNQLSYLPTHSWYDLICCQDIKLTTNLTGRGGRIGRARTLRAGDRGFEPGRVKPMTYKIDTCHFLARGSTLLG